MSRIGRDGPPVLTLADCPVGSEVRVPRQGNYQIYWTWLPVQDHVGGKLCVNIPCEAGEDGGIARIRPAFISEKREPGYHGPLVRGTSAEPPPKRQREGGVKLECEAEYAELRQRYLAPIVSTGPDAELAMGVRLRRKTQRAFIDIEMPGFKALKAKIQSFERAGDHKGIYTLLSQLKHWQQTPNGAAPPAMRMHESLMDALPEFVDLSAEERRELVDVDAVIADELLVVKAEADSDASAREDTVKQEDGPSTEAALDVAAVAAMDSAGEVDSTAESDDDLRENSSFPQHLHKACTDPNVIGSRVRLNGKTLLSRQFTFEHELTFEWREHVDGEWKHNVSGASQQPARDLWKMPPRQLIAFQSWQMQRKQEKAGTAQVRRTKAKRSEQRSCDLCKCKVELCVIAEIPPIAWETKSSSFHHGKKEVHEKTLWKCEVCSRKCCGECCLEDLIGSDYYENLCPVCSKYMCKSCYAQRLNCGMSEEDKLCGVELTLGYCSARCLAKHRNDFHSGDSAVLAEEEELGWSEALLQGGYLPDRSSWAADTKPSKRDAREEKRAKRERLLEKREEQRRLNRTKIE